MDTPTPTPEPTVEPWATPTPLNIEGSSPLFNFSDFDDVHVTLAETAVSWWQGFNTDGGLDIVGWAFVIMVLTITIRRVIRRFMAM